MKLLRVRASHYKNCCDDLTIDFVAKSKKTTEDKEYELQEVSEGLYVYNTVAFVGKNASGKTSVIELLDSCYSILGEFRLEGKNYNFDGVSLELVFYHEGNIYLYTTVLRPDITGADKAVFTQQHLFSKRYYKSIIRVLYEGRDYAEMLNLGDLPEDTSIVFFILKKKIARAVYFDCNGEGANSYRMLFAAMKNYRISAKVLEAAIRVFDANIQSLTLIDEKHYRLVYGNQKRELSDTGLIYMLSSGTTKGLLLYIYVVAALKNGFDLLIDEVENHFHKTLVENTISLFKDRNVNRHGASLLFTTHYCELLDLFNRQDNIWIARADDKVQLDNMYEAYDIRPELVKSRQFYNDAFQTSVNYEDLMKLKKELML